MAGANDNFSEGSLAGSVMRQARAIAGSRKINEIHLSIAIADEIEREFQVGRGQVLVLLDGIGREASEIMAEDDANLILRGIGYTIAEWNDRRPFLPGAA